MHTIIEIKTAYKQLEQALQCLLEHSAYLHGIDTQTDMYYEVPQGRLKIREGNIEHNLIFYNRIEEKDRLKESAVELVAITPENKNIIEVLKKVLQQKVVVKKTRKILFIDYVKFNLDDVAELGSFLEIEAINDDGSISKEYLTNACEYYMKLLHIKHTDIITSSYSDMILEKKVNVL
jgi:adenylate cyclase, class 2